MVMAVIHVIMFVSGALVIVAGAMGFLSMRGRPGH
jgi:hypothetical protein